MLCASRDQSTLLLTELIHFSAVVKEEEEKESKKTIDIGKEAAIEAEVRAARERAIVPLETRIKSFKDMLAEKDVSLPHSMHPRCCFLFFITVIILFLHYNNNCIITLCDEGLGIQYLGKGTSQDSVRSALPSTDFERTETGVREVREGESRGGATGEEEQDEGAQRAVSETARRGQSSRKVSTFEK